MRAEEASKTHKVSVEDNENHFDLKAAYGER